MITDEIWRPRPDLARPRRLRAGSALIVLLLAAGLASPLAAQTANGTTGAPAGAPTPPAKPPPAAKPTPPADDEDSGENDANTVLVRGRKPPPQPGAVVGDIKPELQLNPADIQSYGVSTVTELLNELAPETRSDRGRGASTPVVLLNGRRISSFNEIQNIPTEAILRVDILPEEVSLKYGYTADQRVVNIVLRRRFRAITGELAGGGPTEGGQETGQGEADLLHLRGDSRLNLDLKYQISSDLTDADRDIVAQPSGQPFAIGGNVVSPTAGAQIDPALSALAGRPITVAGIPAGLGAQRPSLASFLPTAGLANSTDLGADRTLLPATQSLTANAVLSRPIFAGIQATVNATLGGTTSDALQGLPSLGLTAPNGDPFSPFSQPVTVDRYVGNLGPLHQYVDGWTAHLGATLNRDLDDWRLSLTTAYDHADSQTDTDMGVNASPLQALLKAGSTSFNPFAPLPTSLLASLPQSTARSVSDSANIQVLANGPIFKVPAGDVYVSAKVGDTQSWQDSSSLRLNSFQAVGLARNDANAQLNIDLPLASATHHVFSPLGEFSVNLNTAVDELSDFGVLATLGYGLNWTPIPGYNLIVSHTHDHAAPTPSQLDGPAIFTPGTRIFDYQTGQTVDVIQVSGGNPGLVADNRNVFKAGLTLKPWPAENFTFTANYIKSRIDNAIGTFPAADAAIEAAYPDRFVRDPEGELVEEDNRPVNFAREDRAEIRWGFNYSRPIGPQPKPQFDRRALLGPGQGQRRRPDGSTPPGDGPGPGGGGQPAAPTSGGGGGGGGGGSRPRGGGGGGGGGGRFGSSINAPAAGRFQIAVYHTVILNDSILVRPGGPVLDLLNGAPASGTGGQYQHEIEAQLGFTLYGAGARISADWKSATVVRGGAGQPADDLSFSDIGTINLRLFDNLGQQKAVLQRYPWLRGARVTLNVTNLFDQRIQVRDGTGATPLGYQGPYLDPAGRTVQLSLRKLFY